MMSMLMLVCGSAMAENIIWQEDWSGYDEKVNPQGINAMYTFTGTVLNDDGSIKSGTKIFEQNLAGGEAPELLVAKNGGAFAAKVAINGISGDVTLTFKTNRNDLSVSVEGATLGEKSRVGNDDTYTVTIPANTTEITITFTQTSSSNARLDNIKLYQGTAKKPAGLSWGKASTTLTIGEEVTLVLQNANNLPVEYSSSDETVATISSEGTITLKAAGKTTFTASFAGNDEYEAQTVSIEVTVKEGQTPVDPVDDETITVANALALINALEDGAKTNDSYYVKGYVVAVTEISTQYGNATFTIADEKGGETVLTVFRVKGLENKNITDENLLKVDDEVVVYGQLQKYVKNGEVTPEVAQGGYIYSINGQTKAEDTPEPQVEQITVTKALEIIAALEDGKTTSETYQVKGFVVAVTEISTQYGNATFTIADEKGGETVLTVYRIKGFDGENIADENLLKVNDEVVVEGKLQKYVKNGEVTPEVATGGKIISINGQGNSISTVMADAQQGSIYNLQGHRVEKATKGLYIINGKKVLVK